MSDAAAPVAEPVSRRRMFRWLRRAATAGAGAVVASSLLDSSPAAGADGGNFLIGTPNVNTTNPTSLTGPADNTHMFKVTNNSSALAALALIGEQSNVSVVAGAGVYGLAAASSGSGVVGVASGASGVGFRGSSTTGAAMQLLESSAVMPPSTNAWAAGSFVVKDGHVWYCYFGGLGPASKWVRLSSTFVPLASPARVYDSRGGLGPLATSQQRAVTVTGTFAGITIPAGISAALTNLTCAGPTGSGYLAMFKDGTSWTGTSNVNFVPGVNVANNATSAVSAGGKVSVLCGGGGATDFIVDVFGFYL